MYKALPMNVELSDFEQAVLGAALRRWATECHRTALQRAAAVREGGEPMDAAIAAAVKEEDYCAFLIDKLGLKRLP
jgi:hypothetical protein